MSGERCVCKSNGAKPSEVTSVRAARSASARGGARHRPLPVVPAPSRAGYTRPLRFHVRLHASRSKEPLRAGAGYGMLGSRLSAVVRCERLRSAYSDTRAQNASDLAPTRVTGCSTQYSVDVRPTKNSLRLDHTACKTVHGQCCYQIIIAALH